MTRGFRNAVEVICRTRMLVMVTLALAASAAHAQQVEEVVVTARKKAENLQDVPISVQAYSGEHVAEKGIIDLQTMAPTIPNFSYAQAIGAGDVLIMRGLGTFGSGPHLEQAVGQVFNGFFTTRARMGRASFVDLAQVELLRGPQGPVIGKNTSLGAINITANRPTSTPEFGVEGGYNFAASAGLELQAMASGPLSDAWRARGVVNRKEQDGWMTNAPSGEEHRGKTDLTARVIIEGDLQETLNTSLLYQHLDYDRRGKPREMHCIDARRVAANPVFAGEDCAVDARNNSRTVFPAAVVARSYAAAGLPTPSGLADREVREGFQLGSRLIGLTLTWQATDDLKITSLTGSTNYDMTDLFDSDLASAPSNHNVRVIENHEDYRQITQELRIQSASDERFAWLAGFNYLDSRLLFSQDFDHHAGGPNPNARRAERAEVETQSLSFFAGVDWRLANALTATLSLRATDEAREAFKNQWQAVYGTTRRANSLCRRGGLFGCFYNPATGEDDVLRGSVDERDLSWNAALTWKYTPHSMLYVNVGDGFKSSGFNIRGNVNTPAGHANFVFGNEQSLNVEVGGKHVLGDGALRFNWTVYNTVIDGIQLASNDPVNISQAVVNGDATARGVEWDLLWVASERVVLGVTGVYTYTRYDEFLGACWTIPGFARQSAAEGCNVDANGDGQGDFQDQSGDMPPLAPAYTVVAHAEYAVPAGVQEWAFGIQFYAVGEQKISLVDHPFATEPAYSKIDASITWAAADGAWRLALVGRNLTDKVVRTLADPTSSFASVGGGIFTTIDETRSVAVRFKYLF